VRVLFAPGPACEGDQITRGKLQKIALSARGGINTKPKQLRPDYYRSDAEKDWPDDTSVRSVDLQKVIMLSRMPGVKSAVFTQ